MLVPRTNLHKFAHFFHFFLSIAHFPPSPSLPLIFVLFPLNCFEGFFPPSFFLICKAGFAQDSAGMQLTP